jgi:hypothetical protein
MRLFFLTSPNNSLSQRRLLIAPVQRYSNESVHRSEEQDNAGSNKSQADLGHGSSLGPMPHRKEASLTSWATTFFKTTHDGAPKS